MLVPKGGKIDVLDLPAPLRQESFSASAASRSTLVDSEKMLLKEALEDCAWNKTRAAERLGISRSTLYDKLKKYDIQEPTTH